MRWWPETRVHASVCKKAMLIYYHGVEEHKSLVEAAGDSLGCFCRVVGEKNGLIEKQRRKIWKLHLKLPRRGEIIVNETPGFSPAEMTDA